MSEWFKNLKKWQKGALIGCGVGLLIVCLIVYALMVNGVREISLDRPGGIVKLWILLLHWLLAWPSFLPFMELQYYDYIGGWALLVAILVVFYGGFGASVGRVQQMTNPVWKWRLTGLLALFLIVFYGSSLVVGGSSYHF